MTRAPVSFERFARSLKLDNGKPLKLEPFQLEFVADVAAGTPECWLVVPEGNGKTTLLAAFCLWHVQSVPYASVCVAAATRDQAMLLYRQAKGFVLRSELDHLYRCQDGVRRIRYGDRESMIQIFAADASTGDGVIPTLAVIDEPHRHKSMDLYLTWSGKLGKRQGQLVAISTAGEPGSEFELIRDQIRQTATSVERRECFGRYASPAVVLHEWALPEDADPENLELVAKANPLRSITRRSLSQKRRKPTMTLAHWRRFTCNMPTRSDMAALTEREWYDARGAEIPDGETIWLGVDIGWKYDPTALVPFYMPAHDDRRLGPAVVLEPPPDNSGLDIYAVESAIAAIAARNPIGAVVMDLSNARDVAAFCEQDIGATVYERGTSLPAQVEDYQRFTEALRNGWLRHSGDHALTRHALNAVSRPLPRGDYVFGRPIASRLAKHQDMRRIDALVAAAMVHAVAVAGSASSVYDDRGLIAV